jgi:predicted ATPase/class 3 adenylate cyclase
MAVVPSLAFGTLLRRWRKAAGLTQEELAERAGLSARGISDLERGLKHRPHRDTVQLLADALQLTDQGRSTFETAGRLLGSGSRSPADSIQPVEIELPLAEAEPSTQVQIFLIVDARGYTAFTQEQGDETGARLAARFAELVEQTVTGWQGDVIELRGDEALVVFSSTRQALRAAVELRARFDRQPEHARSLPLHVGIGLDAGEAVPVKGGYRGRALNLAARLCDLAGRSSPGRSEVFCSETVISLAGRVEGLRYVDRGQARLKNLGTPIRVIQVGREEELPATLPPVQLVSVSSPTNLPEEPTPFIGREREITALTELLRRPSVRLVTLTGAGGTGKTRLALQVGRRSLGDFPDGGFFVSLAPLSNPELVPSTIAEALGVKETSGQLLQETLRGTLREQRLLLLLDNFEHLLPAAMVVADLLEGCRELHILVTSRQPLHLSWEHDYTVPPLEVPDAQLQPDSQRLSEYDAVALFLQRAEAVKADFTLTSENAQAVVDICRRVDGLPLAIELAATRIKLFPPQALLVRLEDRMQTLTGGARDLPPRQQTMRNTVAWSSELLTEEERALFRRLSVFVGGCTAQLAEAVCHGPGHMEIDVLVGLESLVDQSLLVVDEQDGEPRFRMLETVREYALEQLAASRETDQVRRRHAEAFLRLAEEAEREGAATERSVWLARLERENDNLRAALAWSLEQEGSGEMALRLAGALAWFWSGHHYLSEGRRWLEQSLALATLSHAAERHPRAWAQVVTGIGDLASEQGDFATARTDVEQGVAIWRTLNDKRGLASALDQLGWMALQRGDHVQAQSHFEELVQLSRDQGNVKATIQAIQSLGRVQMQKGELSAARSRFEEALALSRKTGHTVSLVHMLCRLAEVAWTQGDTATPRGLYEEALASAQSLQDPMDRSGVLGHLAWCASRLGDYEQAEKLVTERLTLARGRARAAQDWWGIAWGLNHLGDAARCQADQKRAISLYEESLTLFRQHGDRQGIAAVLHNMGHEALAQRDASRARSLFTESLSLFQELKFAWSVADCLTGLAGVAGQEGHPEQAALLYGAAEAAHEAIDASGTLIDPANKLDWEREMTAARGEIDAETWEKAWSTGRAMSIDQALAYAEGASS